MDFVKWENYRIISKGDYNYAYVPNHPNATENGYVLEHRIVMENKINRLLTNIEVVHHKDENKKNNLPDNLELKASKGIHSREHAFERGRKTCVMKCPQCKKLFLRYKNQTYLQKGGYFNACSVLCCRRFSRKLQIEGFTTENLKTISENFIREVTYHGILNRNVWVSQLDRETDFSSSFKGEFENP